MAKDDYFEVVGTVVKALPNAYFSVHLVDGRTVTCTVSGKIRKNFITIVVGDTVTVECTVYDSEKGRISYRGKKA